ncbi:MAG: TrbG/VirB9 family P-type conjugative transfer protein [Sutterella wadsworthensis]|nr:TrbG/VirB9 family P-type conjugative transfer protein [Sutterella wadsworthensis]
MSRLTKSLIALGIGFALSASAVHAANWPTRAKEDARMQYVNYSVDNVTQINAVTGLITTISFEPGETVINYGSGYSTAWEFSTAGNQFFLKPKAEQATTNLVVITDRRTYLFDVRLTWNKSKATYHLQFKYPEEEKRRAEAAKLAKEKADKRKKKMEQPIIDATAVSPYASLDTKAVQKSCNFNWKYTMNFGSSDVSKSIAPIAVYDDGLFTVIRFDTLTDFPAVYRVLGEDGETLVNRHVDKSGALIIRGVYPELRLRAGSGVVGIYNEGYGEHARTPENASTLQGMSRNIKQEADYE